MKELWSSSTNMNGIATFIHPPRYRYTMRYGGQSEDVSCSSLECNAGKIFSHEVSTQKLWFSSDTHSEQLFQSACLMIQSRWCDRFGQEEK
jgi:hypothetical protein